MATNNKRQNNNNNSRKNQQEKQKYKPKENELKPMPIPDDFVDKAEYLMKDLTRSITTSKIRNILSLITEVYNVENVRVEEELLQASKDRLQMIRVRILYEAGRDIYGVKKFVDKCQIINYIKGIGDSRRTFIKFARYMEALVAYHRFYGGKEY